MVRSLWTAATGMNAQQVNVDTIANNLANVNSTGYKAQVAQFKSLLYQNLQTVTTTANGDPKPTSAQVGLGVRNSSINSIFTQGSLLDSQSDTAFAIQGDAFFALRGDDGETYYTRNGDFSWAMGTNGVTLCTSEGYPVLDSNGNQIVIPGNVNSEKVVVDGYGQIGYYNLDGTYTNMNQTLGVFQFNNPAGLEKTSSSLYEATAASGNPMNEATTVGLTRSQVNQKYLESSNVQVADEMVNLIVAQRAYQLNSKAITTADDMLEQANNLKR